MSKLKLLINTPDLSLLGGVSNHYLGLKSFWSSNVKYNTIGTRFGLPGILFMPYDIIKFILKCILYRPSIVMLNPSLGFNAVKRDSMYLMLSKFLSIPTIVFFHGWDLEVEYYFDKAPEKFRNYYGIADGFIVLADEFRSKLKDWGIKSPIHLSTTKVADELVSTFDINSKRDNNSILFLARIEKDKGIYIAIDTFHILVKKHPNMRLTIAGDGSELLNAKRYITDKNIPNIIFTGRISGEALRTAFMDNYFYLFPTYYGEGMPTSTLEAMAFGQIIISRPVGGIKDFFENEKMGFVLDSLKPLDFAEKIADLIENKDKMIQISKYNYHYAKNNFMASIVARKIEHSIKEILI